MTLGRRRTESETVEPLIRELREAERELRSQTAEMSRIVGEVRERVEMRRPQQDQDDFDHHRG